INLGTRTSTCCPTCTPSTADEGTGGSSRGRLCCEDLNTRLACAAAPPHPTLICATCAWRLLITPATWPGRRSYTHPRCAVRLPAPVRPDYPRRRRLDRGHRRRNRRHPRATRGPRAQLVDVRLFGPRALGLARAARARQPAGRALPDRHDPQARGGGTQGRGV